jgi:hypothetical protein
MYKALSLFALSLAVVSAFAVTHKHAHKATKAHPKARVASTFHADPAIRPLVGVWYVNDGGKENRANRLSLNSNGTFVFAGSGWKSKGKYTMKDGALALEWHRR